MFQFNKLQNLFLSILILFNINLKATIDYLDTTFGANANGIVTTNIGSSCAINGVTTDAIGKIVAAGQATINTIQNLVIARYTSGGVLDTTFNSTGIVTTTANNSSGAVGNAVVIDGSGNIVVAGFNNSGNAIVVRYTSSGTLDTTFSGGVVTLSINNSSDATAVAIDANGKIVIGGTSVNSGVENIFVARLNSDGTLDTTFNGGAGFNTIVVNNSSTGNSLAIDQNAKIVIGGATSTNTGLDFLLVRFNSTGTIDTSFGTNGAVVTSVSSTSDDSIQSVVIDSSNRIVASGFVQNGSGGSSFALARYNSSNGSLDTTFGISSTGIVTTSIGDVAEIFASAIDQSGNIVATGFSDSNIATARYTANGSLDTTFGISGVILTSINFGAQAFAMTVQASDGRVVVGGFDTTDENSGAQQFVLIRYNKNNTDFVNTTSIADNSTINTKIPVVSGTSSGTTSPQAMVQVVVNGTVLTTVNTDASGNWNAGRTNALPAGPNKIQANLIISGVTVVSHVTLFTVTDNFAEDALHAYNDTNQTKTTPAFTSLPFDNILIGTSTSPVVGTWTYTSATNTFTCGKSGKYVIQYVGTGGSTSLGTGATAINVGTAIFINSTEYVSSESNTNIDLVNNTTRCLAKNIIKILNAGDTITLNFGVTITGTTSGTYAPGLVVNPNSSGTQNAYSLAITRIG